ncbi:uncharacterized protein LOC143037240 [Oratosquilla oratoria]|uniref:uncharacterized protein LOC143037240 n=1 Tax=Oratosquilla oratoria TaxID=337810 RepID=UPI003F77699C
MLPSNSSPVESAAPLTLAHPLASTLDGYVPQDEKINLAEGKDRIHNTLLPSVDALAVTDGMEVDETKELCSQDSGEDEEMVTPPQERGEDEDGFIPADCEGAAGSSTRANCDSFYAIAKNSNRLSIEDEDGRCSDGGKESSGGVADIIHPQSATLPDICDVSCSRVPHSSPASSLSMSQTVHSSSPEYSLHPETENCSGVADVCETDDKEELYNQACQVLNSGEEPLEMEGAVGPVEDFFIYDNRQISLVPCGITQCDPTISNSDKTVEGAQAVLVGIDLIRQNLQSESHQLFGKWACYLYIPEINLPSFSVDSHGKNIGSEPAPMFYPSPSVSRPASQLTEEEQVKIAKRMGLIQHLPCGIFDETMKNRECVICMIEFMVGDKVRYLPCMHTYHTECIDDWLMRSFTCPSCLEPVDAALLNTYETS